MNAAMEALRGKIIPVLDDGHISLVDYMGDDLAVVDAARVSFFGHSSKHTDAQNRSLLRYLMRGRHTTPFEMCEIKLRVRVPMDAWRQWIRHRTANVNESSTRYAPAIDSAQRVTDWRAQSTDNKQGSAGSVTEWPTPDFVGAELREGKFENPAYHDPASYLSAREADVQTFAREVYEERLAFGVAKEQARKDLPLSTYTEAYWKMDLHNLLHFLSLRLDPHAQQEIREFAWAIADIVKVWVPWTWEAFEDYRLQAMFLTKAEVRAVHAVLSRLIAEGYKADSLIRGAVQAAGVTGREKKELEAKLDRLLSPRG
jgi:thymidylate synthase (FAD)